MSLIENLYSISSIKADIKSAIEAKGVDMTGMSFADFPGAIDTIPSGSTVIGITMKQVAERDYGIVDLWDSTVSFVNIYAFTYDSTISTVDIPNASYIGAYAFAFCENITIVSASTCLYVYGSAFNECHKLKGIYLPSCTSIDRGCMVSCYSLTDVYLPECVTIGNIAFGFCSALETIKLQKCNNIISSAFKNCSLLSQVTLGGSSVCSLSHSNAFTATPIAAGTGSIYVPASLVSDYQAHSVWSWFSSQIFSIPE